MTDWTKRVKHDGKTVDLLTHVALLEAEKKLGYQLTIVQGSFTTAVAASAGTHSGGGAVDLSPYEWQKKVKAMRQVGFAAWHRTAIPGVWGEHIHCILIGDKLLSPAAKEQVTQYYNHENGLADHGPDTEWRPAKIVVFKPPPQLGGNYRKGLAQVTSAYEYQKSKLGANHYLVRKLKEHVDALTNLANEYPMY